MIMMPLGYTRIGARVTFPCIAIFLCFTRVILLRTSRQVGIRRRPREALTSVASVDSAPADGGGRREFLNCGGRSSTLREDMADSFLVQLLYTTRHQNLSNIPCGVNATITSRVSFHSDEGQSIGRCIYGPSPFLRRTPSPPSPPSPRHRSSS